MLNGVKFKVELQITIISAKLDLKVIQLTYL